MPRPTNETLQERDEQRAHGKKRCVTCGLVRPINDFGKHQRTHDGLQVSCKSCVNHRNQQYAKATIERMGTEAYRARQNAWVRESRKRTIERIGIKAYSRQTNLRKYGLTPDEYDTIAAKQNNRCALCGEVPGPHSRSPRYPLEVDHDHKTGRARELLCHGCNLGLGGFNDNPKRIRAALRYLKRHEIS